MRIWITGIGLVTPLAIGATSTMARLCDGDRAFGEVRLFDTDGYRCHIAAEVELDESGADTVPLEPSRTDHMALLAAREALEQADLLRDTAEMGLVVGTTTGATYETEEMIASLGAAQTLKNCARPELVHPLGQVAEQLGESLGPFARVRTVSSACSTGSIALILAAQWLRSGRVDRVLAGAADSLCRLTYAGFHALGVLDPEPCRPFDAKRAGLSLGEGAGFLVLERDDKARERGIRPIAELAGWSAGAEAHHITNPERRGRTAVRLMREALDRARLDLASLDYVNAHGTGTLLNDTNEMAALSDVLGAESERVAISTCKGQIGHGLGAAGVIEAGVAALSVVQGRVPPTGGLQEVAADCRANHIMNKARHLFVRGVLSNSFGFGGLDAVVVLTRPELTPDPGPPARRGVWLKGGATVGPRGVRSILGSAPYLRPGEAPPSGPVTFDDAKHIDAARGRRMGRGDRMVAAACENAWGVERRGGSESLIGLIIGRPSASLDGASSFLRRIRDKGPRFAPPADFPNLLHSASAGFVSIYHGLRGPALTVADRDLSPLLAILTGYEMIEAGLVDLVMAGGVDEWGLLDTAAQADPDDLSLRSEGAAVVHLREGSHLKGSGVIIHDVASWGSKASSARAIAELPPPSSSASVVVATRRAHLLLQDSPWATRTIMSIDKRTGEHDARGAMALVAVAGLVSSGDAPEALVLDGDARLGALVLLRKR